MVETKTLLSLARNQKPALGMYVGDGGTLLVEMAVYAGFDYIRIDCEHSYTDPSEIKNMIRVASAASIPTLVRISSLESITQLLDFGATGILVPDVATAAQAREAVRRCKYAPVGERGMSNITRCVRYGSLELTDYIKSANDEICVAVQIESEEGVKNIDAILDVEGVDIVTTGPQDMSQSFGVPGRTDHPSVVEAQNTVIEAARKHGVPALLTAGSPARSRELTEKGVILQTICFDTIFMMKKLLELVGSFRA